MEDEKSTHICKSRRQGGKRSLGSSSKNGHKAVSLLFKKFLVEEEETKFQKMDSGTNKYEVIIKLL